MERSFHLILDRITNAIYRAAIEGSAVFIQSIAEGLSRKVVKMLEQTGTDGVSPDVEHIQDVVEKVSLKTNTPVSKNRRSLYRAERARARGHAIEASITPAHNIPWAKIWGCSIGQRIMAFKRLKD